MKLHLLSKSYVATKATVGVNTGTNTGTKKILRQVWVEIASLTNSGGWNNKEVVLTLSKEEAVSLARDLLVKATYAD